MKKNRVILQAIMLVIAFSIVAKANSIKISYDKRSESIIDNEINWSDFLERHDIVWEVLPEKFDHGSFHGNGLLGAMIYKDAENRLRWEIGRSDVTAHRRDNNRLPIGGLGLETVGDIQSGTIRLDLYNAESTGNLVTTKGTVKFRTFIHAEEMVVVIELKCTGSEKDSEFKWLPAKCVDRVNVELFPDDKPNPPHQNIRDGEVSVCLQPRAAGGEFATAWTESFIPDNTRRVFLSVADTYPGVGSAQIATDIVRNAAKADFPVMIDSHRQWWHNYYPKSFVSVPDAMAEGFYWAQMYKLACATRRDRMVMDLLGPWFRDTGWPRIWWNLNIEIAYSPVYTSNHLELGESLTNMMDRNRKNFAINAMELYGVNDGATVPHTTCYEGLRGDGSRAPDKYINPGDFTWALHNYWLQYRYSMDTTIITDQQKHAFYSLLRGSVNVYLHILEKGDDGRYHLPVLMSPEYAQVADNNYNLSLLRWACHTLLDICEKYNINDPLIPRWKDVLDKLVDYPVDETGFMIGADMPLERSHRHWQHLQMVFPLYLLDFNDAGQRDLIMKSILHWQNIENGKQIYGWSDAATSCLYSVLQDGNNAFRHLIRHHENKRFVMPNTMYIEGSPVIECALFAAKSLQDMLLQSWGGIIRIFPAIPDVWEDVVFHDLRTEGAFLVSASQKEGKCEWIRIKSLAGQPCRIKPGFDGKFRAEDQSGRSVPIVEPEKDLIEIDIKKGHEIILYNTKKAPEAAVGPVHLDVKSYNYWGNKSGSLSGQ